MKSVKRDIISQNFFLGFQAFTSILFFKVYEKREKKHHQSQFLSWFSPQLFVKDERREKQHHQSEFLSWFSAFTSILFLKFYEKPEKKHHQLDFFPCFSSFHLIFCLKMKCVKKNIISKNFFLGFQVSTSKSISKILWKVLKRLSSVKISLLVFKFSPKLWFEKFMKNVKRNIIRISLLVLKK